MTKNNQSTGSPWPGILIGGILMVAGTYVATQVHLDFQESLEKSGLPINIGETIAVIGVFLILFKVIEPFFITPLAQAITERNNDLEKTFSEAESLRSEMTNLKADYEKRLAETEAKARDQIQGQIKEAQSLKESLMAEANAKAEARLAKADQDIQQERGRVINELRIHAVDMTLKATEKLLGETVDNEKNRKLVQDFIEKAEVAR